MDFQASTVVTRDDALTVRAPAVDTAGDETSPLVHLAIGMLRIAAIAGLMSPLLMVAWLVS